MYTTKEYYQMIDKCEDLFQLDSLLSLMNKLKMSNLIEYNSIEIINYAARKVRELEEKDEK